MNILAIAVAAMVGAGAAYAAITITTTNITAVCPAAQTAAGLTFKPVPDEPITGGRKWP